MAQRIEVPGMGVVEFPDGMTDDQIASAIKANMPAPVDTMTDAAKAGGAGLAEGAIGLLGMGGDVRNLASRATDYVAGKMGVSPEETGRFKDFMYNATRFSPIGAITGGPTSGELKKDVERVTGEFYKPQTTAGEYAHTVGQFLPAAALPGGGAVSRVTSAITAGLGSEAAGQLTKGTAAEPYARLAGGVVGGFAPGAIGRIVTPAPSSAARQRLVDVLAGEGVTSVTAGQRTGNKGLQYAESILGDFPGAGQGTTRIQQEGQQQFTRAAMRRAGQGLADASPETLAQNNARLGNEFTALSARNALRPDRQFINDVTAAVRNYRRVPDSQQRAMVQGYVDDITQHVLSGQMPGTFYQEMRSRLSRQAKSLSQSDPTLSEALRDLRNALDDAMGRSISPSDRAAWTAARREYGAQKTLEKAASRAGEATAEGQIVPANLRNAVSAANRGAYARGEGDFSELARAGSGVMAPLPNSGTAQRTGIQAVISALGGAAGFGVGNVPGAVVAGSAAAAAPAAAGRLLMSRPVQAYLGNQLLARELERLPRAQQVVIRALLSQQRPQLEAQPR